MRGGAGWFWRQSVRVVAVLVVCAVLAGCSGNSSTSASKILPPFVPSASPTPTPGFSHVFVLVMENRGYNDIIGSGDAPYINGLANTYGLATQFFATSHPSLPNYLALLGGDTFGITSDCTDCFVSGTNLVDSLESGHKTWRAYMEGIPSTSCFVGDADSYAQRHNPFIYFNDIRNHPDRCSNIVPLTQLSGDLASAQASSFMWITPNLCHDMHDCSTADGDNWLASFVPTILASSAWKDRGVLFITWDEGDDSSGCCNGAAGGQIVTLVLSPLGKPHYRSSIPYDQYDLLRTVADGLGVAAPGKANEAGAMAMSEFFTTGV
jgi:phosphatidylinositol-3-phosphatase